MRLPSGDYRLRGVNWLPIREIENYTTEPLPSDPTQLVDIWHLTHGEIYRSEDDTTVRAYQSWCGKVWEASEVVIEPHRHAYICSDCAEAASHRKRPSADIRR